MGEWVQASTLQKHISEYSMSIERTTWCCREVPAGDGSAQVVTEMYNPHQALIIYYFHS